MISVITMFKKLIADYEPVNEQERVDQALILAFIAQHDDVLKRSNLVAHLTSSALIVNEAMGKVLFAHHNIYNAFGWTGGHNDGNPDLLAVALKEAKEETNLTSIRPYTSSIIGIDVIGVENHIKHGAYVPDHLHLNVTFLMIADESETPSPKKDENSAVKWFLIDDALEYVDEIRMHAVYKKLFQRVKHYKASQ